MLVEIRETNGNMLVRDNSITIAADEEFLREGASSGDIGMISGNCFV